MEFLIPASVGFDQSRLCSLLDEDLYCFPTLAVDGVLDLGESKPARGNTNEQVRAMSRNRENTS
jgi:hypothetical protein